MVVFNDDKMRDSMASSSSDDDDDNSSKAPSENAMINFDERPQYHEYVPAQGPGDEEIFDSADDDDDASVWTTRKAAPHSQKKERNKDSHQQDPFVENLRRTVVLLFGVLLIGVPLVSFFWFRANEKEQFEGVYNVLADQILDGIVLEMNQIVTFMGGMLVTASSTGADFPIINDFDLFSTPSTFVGTRTTVDGDSPIVMTAVHPRVRSRQRPQWDRIVQDQAWLTPSVIGRQTLYVDQEYQVVNLDENTQNDDVTEYRTTIGSWWEDQSFVTDSEVALPAWQVQPIHAWLINTDIQQGWTAKHDPSLAVNRVLDTKQTVLDRFVDTTDDSTATIFLNAIYQAANGQDYQGQPLSWLYLPLTLDANSRNADGLVSALLDWKAISELALPDSNEFPTEKLLDITINNACDNKAIFLQVFKQQDGSLAVTQMDKDVHSNDDLEVITANILGTTFCPYDVCVYPTSDLEDVYMTNTPLWSAIVIVIIMIVCLIGTIYYDYSIRQKFRNVLETSKVDHAVAKQMFPQRVLQRILEQKGNGGGGATNDEEMEAVAAATAAVASANNYSHPKQELKSILNDDNQYSFPLLKKNGANITADDDGLEEIMHASPIAELFPYCTVAFADISGFSAWSSEREPEQVFTLLESIFQTMDALARRRGVFKVETIGDSYMAVTGLPDHQSDHALRMARFARDCMTRVHEQFRMLEVSLGPDTGELRLKVGMHSGQVTAGVLRGEKTRFQLFGDTVNTASRMESTCLKSRIQISEATARLLIQSGKRPWVRERLNAVHAKGKGILKTFWLATSSKGRSAQSVYTKAKTVFQADDSDGEEEEAELELAAERKKNENILPSWSRNSKQDRLIDWLAQLLETQLKFVVAQREELLEESKKQRMVETDSVLLTNPNACVQKGETFLDEVVEAFTMPKARSIDSSKLLDAERIELSANVSAQIREFVANISDRYRYNSFHSFEHASHVTMAGVKLLKRIVSPEEEGGTLQKDSAGKLRDHTYGIASDALAQFAVVFGALIHDVDHTGVPNGQLGKENSKMLRRYKNQSLAEQNSVDIAWNLLMSPQYKDLQQCIFTSRNELKRFRQYVVNFVMATDIFNPKMKGLRNQRWDKAFSPPRRASEISRKSIDRDALLALEGSSDGEDSSENNSAQDEALNLKATIVLEHIIQAADVSHTMQHWNVYKKWNERLFMEMYAAFRSNRAEKDPSEGWYAGELWFFDNYIIPLAQKLDQCKVFGVSSDECLNYALENRKEWSDKGKSIVAEMVEMYQTKSKATSKEVGGFAPAEIKAFTCAHLEYLIDLLKKKGDAIATSEKWDKAGMRGGAQAWLDALEIYRKCPASPDLKNKNGVFTIVSGLIVKLQDGTLFQSYDMEFEDSLTRFFAAEAEGVSTQDPTHYCQALGAACNTAAARQDYGLALEYAAALEKIYVPSVHSFEICNLYGIDYALDALSNKATWLYAQGGRDADVAKACDYTVKNLLPKLDVNNIELLLKALLPTIWVSRRKPDQLQKINVLFHQYVYDNHQLRRDEKAKEYQVMIPTLKYMLDALTSSSNKVSSSCMHHAIKNSIKVTNNYSLDNPTTRMWLTRAGWCPYMMHAELCLSLAKKLKVDPGSRSQTKVDQALRDLSAISHRMAQSSLITYPSKGMSKKHAVVKHFHDELWEDVKALCKETGYTVMEKKEGKKPESGTPQPLETSMGLIWISE